MARTTTERREHARTPVTLDATVTRISGRSLDGPASTIDVSRGGVRLMGPAGLAVGDVVRVGITKGDISVERQALVVGRQADAPNAKTALLNLAFKVMDADGADLGDLLDAL